MVLYIKSELFDFSILHSTMKWSVPAVSSLIEELKLVCGNRTVTQSKWIDISAQKLSLTEAQSYWLIFTSARNAILGQAGDWIDLPTLGILLLCQCYPNARAREDSFHRSEVLAQSLATAAVSPPPSGAVQTPRSQGGWNALTNLSKLVRDNGFITEFLRENMTVLIGMITLNLVPDGEVIVLRDEVERLAILLSTDDSADITHAVMEDRTTIQSSELATVLNSLSWNDALFPSFDVSSKPQQSVHACNGQKSLYMVNLVKATLLQDDLTDTSLPNVYVVNCCESTIYIAYPVSNVSIIGCVDCEVVLMAATGTVVISYSDKITVRAVTSSLRLENSTDCSAFIYTTRGISLVGDTRGVQLGPFNVIYSQHEQLLGTRTQLYPDSSHAALWCQPLCATLSDSPYILIAPNKLRLVNFPEFKPNPQASLAVCLPQVYADALVEKEKTVARIKQEIASVNDPSNLPKINAVLSGHFREWVTANNRTRTMSEIVKLQSNQ